jgi:hypothetical protein
MDIAFSGVALTVKGFCSNANISVTLNGQPHQRTWTNCEDNQWYSEVFDDVQARTIRFGAVLDKNTIENGDDFAYFVGFESVSTARPLNTLESAFTSLSLNGPLPRFVDSYLGSVEALMLVFIVFILIMVTRTYRIYVISRYCGKLLFTHLKEMGKGKPKRNDMAVVSGADNHLELAQQGSDLESNSANLEGTSETDRLLVLDENEDSPSTTEASPPLGRYPPPAS